MADLLKNLKNTSNIVGDEEEVYRCVASNRGLYCYIGGMLTFSSAAFSDRNMQPSVNRAKLCNNNPEKTKFRDSDGVVSLLTKDIRSEKVRVDSLPNIIEYKIDVIADPTGNMAHAIIIPAPEYKNEKAFKKIQERLAYLATKRGWILAPK